MDLTIRFCHMEKESPLVVNSPVKRGDKIGRMGTTGFSTAAHVHSDMVKGHIKDLYHLSDVYRLIGDFKALITILNQYYYFLECDDELMGTRIFITSYFGSPCYGTWSADGSRAIRWKNHPAYDFVPENRHQTTKNFDMFWPRSFDGICLSKGFDPKGYGNWVNIGFTV